MNLLIINISLRPESPKKLFPVGLGYIATSIKRAGFIFDLLDIDAHRYSDVQIKDFIHKKKYDVVCMGCIVSGYKTIKFLSSVIKAYHPSSQIIVGNSVATSIPETLLSKTEADIAVMGEGDITIVDLLKAIAEKRPLEEVSGICFKMNGKLIQTKSRPMIKDISTVPFIDFSIFDVEVYIEGSRNNVPEPLPMPREKIRGLPTNTARGCIADCTFCYHVFKGMPYRFRNADSIVSEIKSMIEQYGLNYLFFYDELTFFSKKQTLTFVQKIIDEGLHFYWTADCRAGLFDREEDIAIMEKMKQAGCTGIGYSLESSDAGILEAMNKKITLEQFRRQTELFHKAGIQTWTGLVFGYPQETPETIQKTFDCCIENGMYPSVGYLLPQPGSPMYAYAKNHGYIPDEEDYLMKMGDRQDLRINLTRMSDDEFKGHVAEGAKRCSQELGIGLKDSELIKTQYYRAKEPNAKKGA
jgi:anaerobic magnesium-protoporphyrin IX monomethyl ester cyclase